MTSEVAGSQPGEMSLGEHLAELRSRLIRAILALSAGAVVGYIAFPQVFDLIVAPYCDLDAALRVADRCQLLALRPLEPFSVRVKVALVVGLVLGGPIIFYQLWRFITPGLTSTERRYALPFVLGSQIMFVAGIVFAYVILPLGLEVLLGLAGDAVVTALTAQEYLSFFLTTSVAFGVVFEVPLVLVFLSLAGVITSQQLRRFRPYAVVANFALAAIITPTTDAVTLGLLAIPMTLFYEAAIIAARLIERRRRKRAAS